MFGGRYNMKEPLIGILMATYNGEKYISQQIDSILNQTYRNWQLLIHDDGSTDKTVEIVKSYVKKYPDKILLIEDGIKCGGAKENFSHLIKIARANFKFDYIMFSDQDDVWFFDKIEKTLKKMHELENLYGKNKPLLVHTDLIVVDEKLNKISDSFWKYQKINPLNNSLACLILENTVTGCTMMINKTLLEQVRFIPKEAIIHDWWIALICRLNKGEIGVLKEPTIFYRQHHFNDTGAKNYSLYAILKRIIKNNIKIIYRRNRFFKKFLFQTKALIEYSKNTKIHCPLLYELEKVIDNPFKRRFFYLKKKMLCGSVLKKFIKFLAI